MSNYERCQEKFDKLKEAVSAAFTEGEIKSVAEKLDFNVENGKAFVGVDSLTDFLEFNLYKAVVSMLKFAPGSSEFNAANSLIDNYLVLSVLLFRSTEYVKSELSKEAQKIAERN